MAGGPEAPVETVMNDRIEDRARFDLIRYANCWEDADILLQALEIKPSGTYLSVSSAGDNTLSLLSGNPAQVIAADISDAQLACLELRKAAFLNLDYEEVLQFLGIKEAADSTEAYSHLSGSLSAPSRAFWDEHPELIKQGIIHVGKFESYFRIFRKWILPLMHGAGDIAELMKPKDLAGRQEFYQRRWDTASWRLIFRLFFSRSVMGRLGRDPEFFRYVESDVATRLLERAKYALTILPTHDNPYLEYILTGNFARALPHYLRPESYQAIRENLGKLVLFKGGISEALEAHRSIKFDGFNLSDIFEYMSYGDYVQHLHRLIDGSKSGARLAYWNMLADRLPPAECRGRLKSLEERALALFRQDKAFFYKAFRIEEVC
jgi:S-adenosylmethionine-diacylglycerol 3-amino-3-carboxypropyl transferase